MNTTPTLRVTAAPTVEPEEGAPGEAGLRWAIGHALSETFGNTVENGAVSIDPFDSDDIDPLVDAVISVLRERGIPVDQSARQEPPADWSVFNTGAEVAGGLTYADALDYLTPARLERGWSAVCVVNKDNITADPAEGGARQEWQPIDTAPKDQFILVSCPSGYTTIPRVSTIAIMHSDYKVGRWVDHANDDLADWGMVPTHWQPRPADPAEGGA